MAQVNHNFCTQHVQENTPDTDGVMHENKLFYVLTHIYTMYKAITSIYDKE